MRLEPGFHITPLLPDKKQQYDKKTCRRLEEGMAV